MYNKHFGISNAPFRITPDTRHFFGGGQRAEILDTLVYAIKEGEGIIKLTGEIGTGKTMLCRMLQDHLPDTVEVVYLANPSLGRDEIIVAIAIELQLSVSSDTPPLHLQQQLQNYLIQAHRQGRQVVVFIEEAQRMPLETLEEIRLLSNLETARSKLLQLVLFGQPELDQLLDNHDIRQLKDRITQSFDLDPLSPAEVRDYVRFRLHVAGYTGNELFTAPAYRQLARSSRGLIRRLHVLADKAMLAAFAKGADRVHWMHVFRAARDDRPNRHRAFMPKGLAPGLVAGCALAVASVQLLNHMPDTGPEAPASVKNPTSQNIDEIRKSALNMKPAAGLPLSSARLRATQDQLRQPNAGGLTIQLLLSDDDDLNKVEKMLRMKDYADLLPNIYLYRSEVSGRQRWNLLYGNFDSKSKALDALAALPEKVRSQQPYLRSLSALRPTPPSTGLHLLKEEQG
jgi:type II secretory pathway predicted ATPase ExeA